jgi:hypothetical protein
MMHKAAAVNGTPIMKSLLKGIEDEACMCRPAFSRFQSAMLRCRPSADKMQVGRAIELGAQVVGVLPKSDIVNMDEGISALDEKIQDEIMEMPIHKMSKATIVSVGHRAELEGFQSRKITPERRGGGARLVSDI